MGNYYTRIVRVYPKNSDVKLDKKQIAENIVNTALLDEELNVYENKEQNCLDFAWCSKRAGGELGIDKSLVDVWEIRGGGYTNIYFNGKSFGNRDYDGIFFFRFDEIEISGDIDKLESEELIQEIYHYISPEEKLLIKEKKIIRIKVNGIYKADNDYEIGKEQNRINYLEKEEFLGLKGTDNVIYDIMTNGWQNNKLSGFIGKFSLLEETIERSEILFPGLKYFQLYFQGRPVAKILRNVEGAYDPWIYQNSNWWDNCLFPEWIEYKAKKECGL